MPRWRNGNAVVCKIIMSGLDTRPGLKNYFGKNMGNEISYGQVFYKDIFAGILSKTNDGYLFTYDRDFLKNKTPISMTLPLREEPYHSKTLFPFFKGLLPEGWYLDIVSMSQKVDARDHFGVLISTSGSDTINAVTIRR